MGYRRLWGMEHVLKIDTKNVKNFWQCDCHGYRLGLLNFLTDFLLQLPCVFHCPDSSVVAFSDSTGSLVTPHHKLWQGVTTCYDTMHGLQLCFFLLLHVSPFPPHAACCPRAWPQRTTCDLASHDWQSGPLASGMCQCMSLSSELLYQHLTLTYGPYSYVSMCLSLWIVIKLDHRW